MWDHFVNLLQDHTIMSIAFLAWAWVVWHFGRKITDEVKILSERIRQMNFLLSNRITKIEAHLEQIEGSFTPFKNGD